MTSTRFTHNLNLTVFSFTKKGAIWAYEEDVCFFIDERGPNPAQMAMRDPPLENIDPFYERYFEPMSMPRDHKKVQWALRWHKFGKIQNGVYFLVEKFID